MLAPLFVSITFVDLDEPKEDRGRDEVIYVGLLFKVPARVIFPVGFLVSIVSIYPLRLVIVVLSVEIVS